MIIHEPKIEKFVDKVRISSYIEIERKSELSGTLWFEFDKEYENSLSTTSNGFISSMLLLAMYLKEKITVRGNISPKLEYALREVQSYFNFWDEKHFPYFNPRKFHKVKVTFDGYHIEKNKARGVMCTFSGGVDSFYTLYKHLPKNCANPTHRITHCLHLDGFNNPLDTERSHFYNIYHNRFKDMEKKHNIKIISAKSNIQDFYVTRYKAYSPSHYGVTLSAIAMILSPVISRFYISSSYEYGTYKPEGSNPITDPMLSTETLAVIHYDSSVSRIEKTQEIANWAETYDKLMVCLDEKEHNCCRCEKCVRTMITLELAGKLSKYTTFPEKLHRDKVRYWNERNKTHFKEVVDFAYKVNNKKVIADLEFNIKRNFRNSKIKNDLLGLRNRVLVLIWQLSAYLKRRSKLYSSLIARIKNEDTQARD